MRNYSNQRSASASRLVWLEPAVLILSLPVALFANRLALVVSLPILCLIAVPFAMRLARGGWRRSLTPLTLPLLALVGVFIPIATWASPLWWPTGFAKLAVLLWGLAAYSWIASSGDRPHTRTGPVSASKLFHLFLGTGFLASVIAVFGMQRDVSIPVVSQWVDFVPRLPTAFLGFPDGFPTNEVVGMLSVYAPLVFALCFMINPFRRETEEVLLSLSDGLLCDVGRTERSFRRWRFLFVALACGLFLALLLTQSRGGLVGVAMAVVLVLVAIGKRGWVILVVGCVGGLVILFLLPDDRSIEVLALGGSVKGFSVEHLLTGRVEIWKSALHAIRDFPFTGMGLGAFGSVVGRVYPFRSTAEEVPIEDAHNLILQAMLDLGVVGGLVFVVSLGIGLVLLVKCLRLLPKDTPDWYGVLGLLAGLVAHCMYGLTDSVSLGSPAQLPLWFLLGLTIAAHRRISETARGPGHHYRRDRIKPTIAIGIFGSVAVFVFCIAIGSSPRSNLVFVGATKALHHELPSDPSIMVDLTELANSNCRALWFLGLLAAHGGNEDLRVATLNSLIECSPDHMRFCQRIDPRNVELAETAFGLQPGRALSHFWLAEVLVETDTDRAIELLYSGLELEPNQGVRWLRLGDLLAPEDPAAAMEAYENACLNGDPGANGCYRAGRMAERLGKLDVALQYYRMSNWSGARKRADELELQIREQAP